MDHSTVRRLAFIRYLYQTSISQSYSPAPIWWTSILTMQDSVELFLQLASEHLKISDSKKTEFMGYFDNIHKKLGRELEHRESMKRLNQARVSLKHYGIIPSELDIEAFRGSVTNFFNDNTSIVFGITISEVSLMEYVNPEPARNKLKEAEVALQKGDVLAALNKIALSFEEMLRYFEKKGREQFPSSQFHYPRRLSSLRTDFIRNNNNQLRVLVDDVQGAIEEMQKTIKILVLGLDYRKYSKFRQLTPQVAVVGGSGECVTVSSFTKEEIPSVDEARFCIDFVIESALSLAEFDYTGTHP